MGSRSRQRRGTGKIIAVDLSDTSNRTIIHDGLGYPLQVAVNWITKKLYWCDNVLSTIEFSDFNGSNRETLLEKLGNIQTIALDPCGDYIYWISKKSKVISIYTMKLDGINRPVNIILSNFKQPPNSLVIDFISSRLYWAGESMIQASDLKGSNIYTVYMTMIRHPHALSLYGDILYWAEWSNNRIIMYNISGMIINTLVDNVTQTAAIHILDRSRQLRCCE